MAIRGAQLEPKSHWHWHGACGTKRARLNRAGPASPAIQHTFSLMSQHRSLRGASSMAAKRNVLKRYERVELLKKRGQWKDGDRITGLRKTKPAAA